MTVMEFLKLVENHPFILLYYSFSMLLSIVLGRFFLIKLGQPNIWNYFFALLIYVMSVFGIFSVIIFFYQLLTFQMAISLLEILIPFGTMLIAIWIIRRRVDISLLTGFQDFRVFLVALFLMLLTCFAVDFFGWWLISEWPVYLFFLFLIIVTIIIRQILFQRKVIRKV